MWIQEQHAISYLNSPTPSRQQPEFLKEHKQLIAKLRKLDEFSVIL
jgi:hypothetical protein